MPSGFTGWRKALDAEILGRRWWLVLIVGILIVGCGVFCFD